MRRIKQIFSKLKKTVIDLFKDKQKRKIIILFASVLAVLSICVSTAAICAFNYPDYIYIEDEEDLEKIREHLDGDFIFAKQNIEIKRKWIPIGTKEQPFTGTILGNNCTISFATRNFDFLEDNSYNYFGFFGNNSGTIKNLQFYMHETNLNSSNGKETVFGCVSAFNSGSISNCTVIQASGAINITSSSQIKAGGVCGIGSHNFVGLKSSASFSLSSENGIFAGGLVGVLDNKTDMWESQTTGRLNIKKASELAAGGLVGFANQNSPAAITNCSSRNSFVSVKETIGQFGGVVGKSHSPSIEIKNVYSNCNITNYHGMKSSNFICDGNAILKNCVSNPNFTNCSDEFVYGSFAYQFLDVVSFDNCYYTKVLSGSFDDYGDYSPLDILTLEKLKWDSKIWRKNSDGSFNLI